tara:strand:- start:127 stop:300 length:174 start_codon:yes stop_codon:yes gene_type:complete
MRTSAAFFMCRRSMLERSSSGIAEAESGGGKRHSDTAKIGKLSGRSFPRKCFPESFF